MARQSYEKRLEICTNPLMKKLLKIIIEKQSNLCVAADFGTFEETLDFIDRVGKHVCMIKTHCDLYKDWGPSEESYRRLYAKKKEYNFILFDDRKYCDGASIVRSIYGAHQVRYVDLVTVWPLSNDNSYKAIELAVQDAKLPEDEPRGCLAVLEVSFANPGVSCVDTNKSLEIAARNSQVCVGIVSQHLQVPDPCQMIKATPGIHLNQNANVDQVWKPPAQAIKQGADVVIVGRGITASPKNELESVTCQYKVAAWQAYLENLNNAN